MKKTYLLTPGPTPIPGEILAGFAKPIIHHRTPPFKALMKDVRSQLQRLFQTKQDVLLLASTGTGAMEAALINLFQPGDAVITVNGGKFGERWTHLANAYGLKPLEIRLTPGQAVTVEQVREALQSSPGAKAILFQASETSTGVRMPTEALCKLAREKNILSVCDAITACGVFDLPMDAWGIDVLITGSQKALMLPPGLAMLALSDRAWAACEKASLPRFYFDLRLEKKAQAQDQTAWTPAISLIQGLNESLKMILDEGLPRVFERHERLAQATRAAVKALGLEILAKDSPSTAVTAVLAPAQGPDGKKIVSHLRDRHGVFIAAGQDELESKIFRLSHFGYCGPFDVTTAISALELTLHELGYPVRFGAGVGAALEVLCRT